MTRSRTLLGLAVVAALLAGSAALAAARTVGGRRCTDAFAHTDIRTPTGDEVVSAERLRTEDLDAITAGGAAGGHPVRWAVAGPSPSGPVTASGALVVVTDVALHPGARVRALDAATGALVWHRRLPDGRTAVLPLAGATAVALGTSAPPGRAGALRLGVIDAGGRLVACRSFPGDAAASDASHVAVAGDGDRVVAASPTADGSRIEVFTGAVLQPVLSVTVPFAVDGVALAGDVVVTHRSDASGRDDVALAAVDVGSGAVRWRRTVGDLPGLTGRSLGEAGSIGRVTFVGDGVVVTAGARRPGGDDLVDPAPFAVEASSGELRWQRPDLVADRFGTVAPLDGVVVATGVRWDAAAGVVGIDAGTGVDRWRTARPRTDGGAAVGAHALFLGGRPTALDPATGALTPLAAVGLASAVVTPPGRVVFSLSTGVLVALDDPA